MMRKIIWPPCVSLPGQRVQPCLRTGKQVALIIRGDIFVTSSDYTTTKQVTTTPEREKWLSFAHDNRTIAYASEREGNWNIYTAKIAREEEVNFPNATLIDEKALFPASAKERFAPQFSPDGKELAFIEDRTKLMVIDLKTKKVRQVADDKYQYRTGDGFTYSCLPTGNGLSWRSSGIAMIRTAISLSCGLTEVVRS